MSRPWKPMIRSVLGPNAVLSGKTSTSSDATKCSRTSSTLSDSTQSRSHQSLRNKAMEASMVLRMKFLQVIITQVPLMSQPFTTTLIMATITKREWKEPIRWRLDHIMMRDKSTTIILMQEQSMRSRMDNTRKTRIMVLKLS